MTLDTRHIAAIATGASLPLMVFGVAAMQGGLIIALAAALFSLGRFKEYWPQIIRSTPAGMLGLVLLAWLPSVFASMEPFRSFEVWARIPLLAFGATLLWLVIQQDKYLYILALKALLCSAALAALIAFFIVNGGSALLHQPIYSHTGHDLTKPLKAYSNVAMCLVPVLLWAGYILKGRWMAASLGAIAANLSTIGQTGTGAAVAGLLAASAFIGLLHAYKTPKFRIAYFAFLAAALPSAWFWLSNKVNPEAVSPNIFPNWLIDGHRQYIWQFTYEKIWEAPWFGHGMNVIDRVPGAKDHIPGIEHPYIPSHPHNIYLEVGAETGLIGLAVLLAIIVYFAFRLAAPYLKGSTPTRDTSLNGLAVLFLWSTFWASSALNFSLWSAWWELTLFVSMALLLASGNLSSNNLGDQEKTFEGH